MTINKTNLNKKKLASFLINDWAFFICLIFGIYFITLNILGRSFEYFPGDLGDARFNMYLLEHAYKWFTGQESSFWNASFMYPEPKIITYSDNLLGSAPFYSIFRLINCDRETSFQYWCLTLSIMNYSSCYFFLKSWSKNNPASALGAFVFAFSMALQSQMTHAQTFPRFCIPLAFWMGILFLKELKSRFFFATIVFVVYQLYCGIYLGLMLSVPVGIFLLAGIIYRRKLLIEKIKNIKWLLAIVGSILINILIALPLMLPYYEHSKDIPPYSYESVFLSIPTLKSFFFSQPGSILWSFLETTGMHLTSFWDHQIFSGGISTLCLLLFFFIAILKLLHKRFFSSIFITAYDYLFLFTALFTLLLFTRFNYFSFYKIIFNIPGFSSMRAIQRIINIELIFFSIATTFIFSKIIKKKWISTILFIIISIGLIIDNYYNKEVIYHTEKMASQKRTNALSFKMRDIPKGSIISYEFTGIPDDPVGYQLDAMLAAQTLSLKSVNGYSATSPGSYTQYWGELSENGRKNWLASKNHASDFVYIIHE